MSDIINTQEQNGWQQETTIYHRHFTDDQTLNVPGRLHLVDILETTPRAQESLNELNDLVPSVSTAAARYEFH